MLIRLTTENGVDIEQPEQKWLTALLVALAQHDPMLFEKVCRLVDNRVDAYATLPDSVQRSLTGHH